jgi:protein TonB
VQVKKEEPPKREEPKREEPKREESRKEEPKKEEKPAAAAPLPFKREERAPITPMARPEQRPAGPVLVKKDDAAAAKADEKPAPPSRRDEKPAVTPVTVRGGAVAAPKEDLKPAPLAPPAAAAKADPLTAPAFGQPVPERILGPEVQPAKSFFANKWLWIALVVIVLAIGGFFAYRQFILLRPAAPAVSESLDLRAERNAGQLMVTWNREASAIQRAERATLSITDGDHKEDVDLDLGLLRKGSIIYTPLTNDVSFRLEVADLKGGKSTSEAVRVLAGRPSPAVGMPGTSEVPQNLTPQAVPAEKPVPQTPAEVAAAKPTEAPAPTAAPPAVTATPVVTAQPPKPESLASRLSAPVLEMPSLEGQSTSLPGTAVPTVSTFAAPPPTQAPTARPAAGQPPAQPAPRVGGVVQEARLLKRDIPVYPPLARQARVSGTVRVEAVIGTDGKVKSARALNGPPLLRQAATDSVKKWLYQPAMLNGQPTEVTTQVDLTFSPGR